MISTLSLVALGGAIGASLRYLCTLAMQRFAGAADFPVAIMSVNIIGSFAMGVFVAVAAQKGPGPLSMFVLTGVLGGFTTFSAFSLETVNLIESGQFGSAALYVVLSVILSILGLMAGFMLVRGVFL